MHVVTLKCRMRMFTAFLLTAVAVPLTPCAFSAEISIPDPALDAALRTALSIPDDPLQDSDLAALASLTADNAGIRDLTGLEYCSQLSTLSLKGNAIRSVAPLGALPELAALSLENNQICDLSPLAANLNLNGTDLLYVDGNPLSVTSCALSISTMVGRGVTVEAGSACDTPVPDCPLPANIPDPALDAVLRNALGNPAGPLYSDELASLTNNLFASYAGIVDLTGIEFCTNVSILELEGNPINSLAPLTGLTNLEVLYLSQTGVTDLSSVSTLTGLKQLFIDSNGITTLPNLDNLVQLTNLTAANNQISDLSPLEGGTSLIALTLSNNQIADLSPLDELSNLESLGLSDNQIVNPAPLSGLNNLTQLRLAANQIADLSNLSDLPSLRFLNLGNNQLTDLGTLQTFPSLTFLSVNGNPLTSLAGLSPQPVLETVFAVNCAFSDLSPLAEVPSLLYLSLDDNPITDLSPLAELVDLLELEVRNAQVTSLSPLADLAALSYIDFAGNQVADLSPLAGVLTLEEVYFDDNQVADISPLAGLTALNTADFNRNKVCDLSPLLLGTAFQAGDNIEAAGNPLTVAGCDSVAALDALGVDITVGTACDDGGLAFCEGACENPSANLVQNGGFEAAVEDWVLNPSDGSVSVTGGLPYEGALGGLLFAGGLSGAPTVTLSQDIQLPVATSIGLKVYLAMFQLGPDTTGAFSVKVDGATLATVAQEDVPAFVYELLTADLSAYADGGTHTLALEFAVSEGSGATSSIAVDAVTVIACDPVAEGEGEGVVEGIVEGEGEGLLEGEGEGVSEGEGVVEGVLEGEGEGLLEGEGEGLVEGEGEGLVEGEGEGEGEGELANPYEQLLRSFADADANEDKFLTLAEAQAQVPGFTQQDLDDADYNGDGELSVGELLQHVGGGILISADTNGDFILQLTEMLRLIQFYNAGQYSCAENAGVTEDGFALTAPLNVPNCVLHSIDRDGNKVVTLSELLRGIQLFNLGGYTWCPGTGSEDGFCG